MNSLVIFGKRYIPKGRKQDDIQRKLNRLFAKTNGKETAHIVREFLADLLHAELAEIYDQIVNDSKIDVFGNLDFEVAETIDERSQRIAKMKENRIIVKLNAVSLPRNALKYVVAHEMAHLMTKKHGKKFWKALGSLYPSYEKGQKLFAGNEELLTTPLKAMLT
jgi:predicted metal-dependent hydrolase